MSAAPDIVPVDPPRSRCIRAKINWIGDGSFCIAEATISDDMTLCGLRCRRDDAGAVTIEPKTEIRNGTSWPTVRLSKALEADIAAAVAMAWHAASTAARPPVADDFSRPAPRVKPAGSF